MKGSKSPPPAEAPDKTIGEFVADDYRTAKVFERYGMDFCCGGNVALSAACRQKGVDPALILREIEEAKSEPIDRSQNFGAWELPFLADYIVTIHHSYINLAPHLREEEEVFFPAVKRADGARKAGKAPEQQDLDAIRGDLAKLRREHEEVGEAIHSIRHLAKEYAIPADACNTYAVTYQKLREFEDDLHKHVHLENNILFLKAEQL
jgi:regulator of cell morphogenesis and NO signaling